MAFKVFLSYSTDPDENPIVWRLQTLAASHGIQMYVPQRSDTALAGSRRKAIILPNEVRRKIETADCVLAIITSRTGTAVEKELNYASARGRLIIPIVEEGIPATSFGAGFGRVFTFSRADGDPGKVESEVLEFLKQQRLSKENRQTVGALVSIGMGLLLLSSLEK